jgi:hypothetical protein
LLLAPCLAACTLSAAGTGTDEASTGTPGALPPPGYGTLSQRDVSLSLRSGDLQILVTPLAPAVLVATAPDTYRRLDALAAPYRTSGSEASPVFLVSFYSDRPDARFVAEEVQFVSGGLRARPASIHPVTPRWGSGRVAQRETEMAVYVFDRPVDLESDVVLHYGLEESTEWAAILTRIQAERARARARATGGPD